MMKKIITILSILFATVFYSQNNKTNNYKYGFIDENGKEVTPLKYDKAESFSNGIAEVCIGNKWGFINKNGKEITPVKYDTTYTCNNGVARIKLNGKYGLIDQTGKEITAIKYDNMGRFDHDVACVKINGKWGIINNKGIEITPLKYDYMQKTNTYGILCLKGKDKITLIDEDNKPIESNPLGYFSDNTSYFDESGIAKVCIDGKWGFIDKTGKEVSAIKYDYVFFFSEGMARVLLNNKWGFIDESGNEVIPLIYYFSDEAFERTPTCGNAFYEYPKRTYIYKNGKPIMYDSSEFLSEGHTYFNNGLVRVHALNINTDREIKKDGFFNFFLDKTNFVFLDKKGKLIKSTKYDSVSSLYYNHGRSKMEFYYDDLRKVEKYENGYRFGFADTLGKMVIPFKYGSAGNFKNGVAEVSLNHKSGLIDRAGNQLTPLKYDSIWDFYDGVARVNVVDNRRKWGIINNEGKELTPIKYDYIKDFNEGFALVELKDKIGYIDTNGKEVIAPKYSNGDSFKEGFADVVYGRKVGFIDKTGKKITPFKYDRTESFKNGFARVSVKNKWGYINKTGNEVTSLKYDSVEDFEEGLAVVKMLNN